MEETEISNNVARAIATALDWTSSPDARAAAHSYLETVRAYSNWKISLHLLLLKTITGAA